MFVLGVVIEEDKLFNSVSDFISKEDPNIIIFEDYDKGVLTPSLIKKVIELCKESGVITAVDPKRKNFFNYKYVDIFKPNLKEVKEALNLLLIDPVKADLEQIHHSLQKELSHAISFITLSEKGVFYQENGRASIIPSHLRNIADVSGAGDTVIAVASLVYAATRNVHLMAEMANIAGGVVCEEVGTVAIEEHRSVAPDSPVFGDLLAVSAHSWKAARASSSVQVRYFARPTSCSQLCSGPMPG